MGEDIYKPCAHIKDIPMDDSADKGFRALHKELVERISREFDLLPTFEKSVFEDKFIKHYSLLSNEKLECRWKQYRDNIDKKVFAPFQFPEMRDLHFYNGTIRFMPALTVSRQLDKKKKLKPGPRVDWRGQVPIPVEMQMRRGAAREDKAGAIKDKPRKNKAKDAKKVVSIDGKKDAKQEAKTAKKDPKQEAKTVKKDPKEEAKTVKKDVKQEAKTVKK